MAKERTKCRDCGFTILLYEDLATGWRCPWPVIPGNPGWEERGKKDNWWCKAKPGQVGHVPMDPLTRLVIENG